MLQERFEFDVLTGSLQFGFKGVSNSIFNWLFRMMMQLIAEEIFQLVFYDDDSKAFRNQFSDLLNFNRFNEINETVITRLYESINSITVDSQGKFVLNYKVLDYESYYTPYDVCSFIVDRIWEKSSKEWEQNVLDPTSGSGNLVISYIHNTL